MANKLSRLIKESRQMFGILHRSSKTVVDPEIKSIATVFIFLVAATANGQSFAQVKAPSSGTPPVCEGGRCSNSEVFPLDVSLCSPGPGGFLCPSTNSKEKQPTITVLTTEQFDALQNIRRPSQTDIEEAHKSLAQ
jgi:hypothetical protein